MDDGGLTRHKHRCGERRAHKEAKLRRGTSAEREERRSRAAQRAAASDSSLGRGARERAHDPAGKNSAQMKLLRRSARAEVCGAKADPELQSAQADECSRRPKGRRESSLRQLQAAESIIMVIECA